MVKLAILFTKAPATGNSQKIKTPQTNNIK